MTTKKLIAVQRNQILQTDLLHLALALLTWFSIPMLLVEMIATMVGGPQISLIGAFGNTAIFSIFYFFRHKFEFKVKVIGLVFPIWAIGLFTLSDKGLQGFGMVVILLSHILAIWFFNRTALAAFSLLSMGIFGSIAYLNPDQGFGLNNTWAWIAALTMMASLTYVLYRINHMFRDYWVKYAERLETILHRTQDRNTDKLEHQRRDFESDIKDRERLRLAIQQIALDSRQAIHDIMGLSDLLMQKHFSMQTREILQQMASSGVQLQGIIEQALDIAHDQDPSLEDEQDFDPIAGAKELIHCFQAQAQRNGAQLKLVVDPNTPALCRGHATRISNILRSFFQVALSHTHHGEIVLQIKWEGEKHGKDLIRWIIRDNGFGLTPSQWRALWSGDDQTAPLPTQPISARTLQNAQIWVSKMDGELTGQSNPGLGTELQLGLPLARAVQRDHIWANWILSLRGLKVLLVDDQPFSNAILIQYLSELGFEVHTAESDRDALQQAYNNDDYQLILLSSEIQGLGGFELSRQIRKILKSQAGILLLVHTIQVDQSLARRCDADGVLEHPFGRPQLTAKVIEVLRNYIPLPKLKLATTEEKSLGKVMVISAHDIERWVLQELLKQTGYEVHQARSNEEAHNMMSLPGRPWSMICHANNPNTCDSFSFYELLDDQRIQSKFVAILSPEDNRQNEASFPWMSRPVHLDQLRSKMTEMGLPLRSIPQEIQIG